MGLAEEGLDLGGVGAALAVANRWQRDGADLIALAVRMRAVSVTSLGVQASAFFDAGPAVRRDDRPVADAVAGGGPLHAALLGLGERGGLAGLGNAGAFHRDPKPGPGLQDGDGGQRLIDRGGRGVAGHQVPASGGDGGLGAGDAGGGVGVIGVLGQPGDVRGGLPFAGVDGVRGELAPPGTRVTTLRSRPTFRASTWQDQTGVDVARELS